MIEFFKNIKKELTKRPITFISLVLISFFTYWNYTQVSNHLPTQIKEVHNKIDQNQKETNKRFDDMNTNFNKRFDDLYKVLLDIKNK